MAIKPFRDLLQKSFVNNVATRAWVVDLLRKNLGKLHFTGDVSQTADGHINFSGGGGAGGESCDYPFAVTVTAGAASGTIDISVATGLVRLEGGVATPTISGVALDASTPPKITASSSSTTRYLIMEVEYQPVFGTIDHAGIPITYISGATFAQTPRITLVTTIPNAKRPTIVWPDGTSDTGKFYTSLAAITGVASQGWWGNMNAIIKGDGTMQLNIGG